MAGSLGAGGSVPSCLRGKRGTGGGGGGRRRWATAPSREGEGNLTFSRHCEGSGKSCKTRSCGLGFRPPSLRGASGLRAKTLIYLFLWVRDRKM